MKITIYSGSLKLTAPFKNDVVDVLSPILNEYWEKNHFSFGYIPINQLKDKIVAGSRRFSNREVSARLNGSTLSDLQGVTLIGDDHASYLFSVTTTDKDILEKTISDVRKLLTKYLLGKLKEDKMNYFLEDTKKVCFDFEGDVEEIIDAIPYADLLHEFFLDNNLYPARY